MPHFETNAEADVLKAISIQESIIFEKAVIYGELN